MFIRSGAHEHIWRGGNGERVTLRQNEPDPNGLRIRCKAKNRRRFALENRGRARPTRLDSMSLLSTLHDTRLNEHRCPSERLCPSERKITELFNSVIFPPPRLSKRSSTSPCIHRVILARRASSPLDDSAAPGAVPTSGVAGASGRRYACPLQSDVQGARQARKHWPARQACQRCASDAENNPVGELPHEHFGVGQLRNVSSLGAPLPRART
jgi:hypothetical protein